MNAIKKDIPGFQKVQYEFSAHIKDPENAPLRDDVEDRRMGIYRDLFYKNVEGFISSSFPVLRKLYNDDDWHNMVRDFFIKHECHSPYFLEISEEFLGYLQNERETQDHDPIFIQELAHYEWVELALSVLDEKIDMTGINANGDLIKGSPVISPLAWALTYQWPVHTLGPDNQLDTPPEEQTHIVVYRDRNDKVRFVIINMVTAVLLNLFEENPDLTGEQACLHIAEQMQHPNPEVVIQGGKAALDDLLAKGILLGAKNQGVSS